MQDLWWVQQNYDVAIVGGGINGLAIARDAALRGLKTILFEQEDIGAGASTKTSKLAHGGVRYLEQGDIPVVRDSIKARRYLLQKAPHLVKPLPFLYPVYNNSRRALWQVRLGLTLYDLLDWRRTLPRHQQISKEELQRRFPTLSLDGLQGCCLYYDAQMDDVRLNVATMLGAREAGAIIATHTSVTDLVKQKGEIIQIGFESQMFGISGTISAQMVINATGPWAPTLMAVDSVAPKYQLVPSKGVHLVLPQVAPDHALILQAPQDGRVFFVIPWKGMSLLGATETPFEGNPADVSVTDSDRNYLLEAFRHYFPQHQEKAIAEFAGVRPLAGRSGRALGSISRRHVIEMGASGLLSVLGGKYTTFQEVAREVVDIVAVQLRDRGMLGKCQTGTLPIYGGDCQALLEASDEELVPYIQGTTLSSAQARRLIHTYGSQFVEIVERVRQIPEEGKQICELHPQLYAELSHAILREQALTPEDWYFRRTSIGYSQCGGRCCREQTVAHFRQFLESAPTANGCQTSR